MVCTCNGILFRHKKEWNFDIRNNVDGPWKHYANWNKPDTKGQILYLHCVMLFHLYELTRKGKFLQTESRIEVTR